MENVCLITLKYCNGATVGFWRIFKFFFFLLLFEGQYRDETETEKLCHWWSITVSLYTLLHPCSSHLHSLEWFWTMQTWAVINPTVSIFVFRISLNFLPESLVYLQWQLPVPWRILNTLHTRQPQSDSYYVCECKQQLWIDLKRVMKINSSLAKI